MKKFNLKNFFTIKLSICFTIIFTVIVTIAVIFLTLIMNSNFKNIIGDYENNIASLQTGIVTTYSQILKRDIETKNYTNTRKISELLLGSNVFKFIYSKDSTGKIIEGEEPSEDEIINSKTFSDEISEKISVYYAFNSVKNNIAKDDVKDLYTNIFIIIFVISIIVSIILSDVISKPLEGLSKAAKEITDGNFDVKIEKSPFTEINDLIYSYNEMGFQLNELYSSLELKVQERTIALETANHKLQETQAMMVHSEKMRSLGELVAGIAHEINNPINFIHGNIMILQNYSRDLFELINLYETNSGAIPEDIKTKIETFKNDIDLDFLKKDINDLIKSCIEGTQRTKNIVLDLKNFSRMEEMVLTQFDIPKEIDTTLNILNNKYKNRITVIKNYAPDTPKIEAYGGQLNQVFMNILDNAQDAIKETGTLTINTYKDGENVRIEFIDTGSGIPEENLNKIFDPFFTTKTVGKGTGLGMSISYRVINDHKGRIEVESKLGKGTKFTITLPVVHKKQESTTEEETINNLLE